MNSINTENIKTINSRDIKDESEIRNFLIWLSYDSDFNIHEDDIDEIIEDYMFYLYNELDDRNLIR
jgi:hypothetical protein